MKPKNRTGTLIRSDDPHTMGSALGILWRKVCAMKDPEGTPSNPASVITMPNLYAIPSGVIFSQPALVPHAALAP